MARSRYERLGKRYGRAVFWSFFLVGFFVVIVLAAFFIFGNRGVLSHQNVVIAGDPTIVLSRQPDNGQIVVVTIPADIVISAVHGYGKYSLRALWELGHIDKKDGAVLAQSLQDALSVPLPWYVGDQNGQNSADSDTMGRIRTIFSARGFLQYLGHTYRSNLPLLPYLRLAWSIGFPGPDRWVSRAVGDTATAHEELPDGTTIRTLTPDSLQSVLGDAFEDAAIRKEGLRVAVYNTTATPGLAEHVAGIINRLGAVVVRVGNQSPRRDRCQVRGEKRALSTKTASAIVGLYGCDVTSGRDTDQADLVVSVGSDFEKRYLPSVR